MLQLTKRADYGLIAMKHLAERSASICSAKEISEAYEIPSELMAKILQSLARKGLVISHHGSHGGYSLGRLPSDISAAEVIEAVDGPFSLAACGFDDESACVQYSRCTVREPLRKLNENIRQFLSHMTISEMTN